MPQLLSLSRAARLVGVTRSKIQKKIQNGELSTFEGKLQVTELLRAYPETQIDDTHMLERVKQIKAAATFTSSREHESALPSQDVLIARLIKLGKELVEVKSAFNRQSELLDTINNKLAEFGDDSLHQWLSTEIQRSPKLEPAAQLLANDTVLRIIAAQVKVIPSGHDFFVEGKDSILEAALRAGLAVNYGCENGNCGACKARIVSGEVQTIRNHDYVFTDLEKQMNYQLLCSCTAITDLTIEAAEAHNPEDIPLQQVDTKVKKLEQLNEDLFLLRLQTPRTKTLRFLAGQYATLQFDNTEIQAFIASCPCDGRNLEFHLSCKFKKNLKLNQIVKLEAPHGDFVLQEDLKRPALFITDDKGFPPIKSLIEHVIASDNETINHLYWITNDETEPYQHNLCRSWVDALDDLKYTRTQTINQIVTDYPDLSNFEVYIAGSDDLISAAAKVLTNKYHIAKLRGEK
ncbi:2Fe-2S iron-sulfur cluster-binding protein [Candidatus Marithrix sp. Canyon 246]|uniref:2Fe-2S iron-sulfur cluster-binding protein n=1 Tax=Candidatus Marithrix sp. Canyon 246 TaxID=1827136 RepID=UPI00084A2D14|nr:2Fe-2S iron-sulfur cluster-binding protein [Candidatus Marithrix sp. Canyon 246]